MDSFVRKDDAEDLDDCEDARPLSGEDLKAALDAMSESDFIERLIAGVIHQAKAMGLWSPLTHALVGEHDATALALLCLDKCLGGQRKWNRTACPSFYAFCRGQVRSILGNEARKAKRNLVDFVSPLPTTGPDGEEVDAPVPKIEGDVVFAALASHTSRELGDRFLTDFALSLPENSAEQRIIMLVLDDRSCARRARCMEQLAMPGDQYEAAVKRIERALRAFQPQWLETNKISADDWREAS